MRLNTKAGKGVAFGDLAQRWLETIKGGMKASSSLRRQTAINSLKPHFSTTVRGIERRHVEARAASRNQVASARTFNIERETLIQILDYAVREGLLLDNPARLVERRKQHQAKVVIPSKAQFQTLLVTLRKADVRYRSAGDLCELLAYSGWGDVNFELKNFTVTGGDCCVRPVRRDALSIRFGRSNGSCVRLPKGSKYEKRSGSIGGEVPAGRGHPWWAFPRG